LTASGQILAVVLYFGPGTVSRIIGLVSLARAGGQLMASDGGKRAWTVLNLLNWTTRYFETKGIGNARLNAEVLLGKTLGLERIMLYARFDQVVTDGQRDRFRELVRRRAAREPLQHLVGTCEFYGRTFEVNSAVMVPRQETELVVAKCLEKVTEGADGVWAADLGTGSGIIAVSLAVERPGLHVVATDASEDALAVAERNARAHGVQSRVRFARGDLTEPVRLHLPPGRECVDLVVSNPPYVPTDQIERLEPEVRDHEPREALDGGPDGLGAIRRLIPEAAELLCPAGWLVFEMGEGQANAVRELIGQEGAFASDTVQTELDAGGCERVACVQKRAG